MKSLTIVGMKSFFKPQKIQLSDITIFAGANSSGKSTAAQSFLLLKQTAESQYEPGALLIDGPNVKFTALNQILSKRPGFSQQSNFTIGIETNEGDVISTTFEKKEGTGINIKSTTIAAAEKQPVAIRVGKTFTEEESNYLLELAPENNQWKPFIIENRLSAKWQVVPNRCFLDLVLFGSLLQRGASPGSSIELFRTPWQQKIKTSFSRLIHIQGLRGNPERTYSANARALNTYQGLFTDYVASVIQQWQDNKDEKLDALGTDLRDLGLSWKVRARRVHDTQVEIQVGRLPFSSQGGAHDLVNLADVGIGVSQVLPFLVALHTAKKGQIVFVEQPEIHLHPKAQYRLAWAVINAAKRGVRVWIETHSSALLKGVQTAIVQGEVDSNKVSLNWFSRDPSTGTTVVTPAGMNQNGQYGEWPVDFDETSLIVEKTYLDAVAKKIFS